MEKKKLNVTTIEKAIENEALAMSENDKNELISLILINRKNEDNTMRCNFFMHGKSAEISAIIAMRMFDEKSFRNMIYTAVRAYEKYTDKKVDDFFNGIIGHMDNITASLEAILGKKPSWKKDMRKP